MNNTATLNHIEIRKAGMKALNDALGQSNARTFLRMFSGTGNFAEDRHKWNPDCNEEIIAGIKKLQEDYAQGKVDIAGQPITKP